jgi:hypothetical protein
MTSSVNTFFAYPSQNREVIVTIDETLARLRTQPAAFL